MKKTSNIFTIVLSAIAFGVFFFPLPASADISQLTNNVTSSGNPKSNQIFKIGLGDGWVGTITNFEFYSDSKAGSPGNWTITQLIVDEYNDEDYTSPTGDYCTWGLNNAGGTVYADYASIGDGNGQSGAPWDSILESGTGCSLSTSKYYLLTFTTGSNAGNSPYFEVGGANISDPRYEILQNNTDIGIPYFRIVGPVQPITLGSGNTRIQMQNSPLPGVVEPDTTVTFDFDYFQNDLQTPFYTRVGVQVVNVTAGLTYNTSAAEQDILSSGGNSYTQDLVLTDTGDHFQWRPYLKTASSTFIFGDWYSFSVVDQNPDASPFSPIGGGFGTSTTNSFCDDNVPIDDSDIISATLTSIPNGLCKAVAFLVVPSEASVNAFQSWGTIIPQKIPFSYAIEAYGIYNDLNTAISTTSTTNFPTLELDYGSTTSSFHGSVVLFSSSTVNALFPPEVRNNFRNLMSVVLWLSFAGYMLLLVKKLTMPVDLT